MSKNQEPRILIFSTAYFPLIGGAEVAIKEITNRIHGFKFDLITARIDSKLAKYEKIGNINVYRIGLGWQLDKFILPIFGLFKAIRLNKQRDYGIIWSIMASQAGVAASFFRILKPKKKLLLTLQEGDLEEHLQRYVLGLEFLYKLLIRPWHRMPFKKADHLTVISYDLKERALKNNVKVLIDIVPNGVNVEHFSQTFSEQELDNLRKELHKGKDDIFIIHSGRIAVKNALEDVVKSLQYLPDNVKFFIMGDGASRKKLETIARDLNIDHRVIFFGLYDYRNLPKYLAVSDIFIRPSLSEGQGISFLEAMAAGVPVIATPVGGIVDFLFDPDANPDKKSTGLFCQVRDPKSIAQKIRQILNNEQIRKTLIENGLKLVQEKYDWDLIAKKMKKIFKNLI